MGNHPSAITDDGQSPIHVQSYTVRGPLYARSITASTLNAGTIHARRITCQSAQICSRQTLPSHGYPNPPHRAVTAHTINADIIYADEINCKTLRCYDVFVGDGAQWQAKRTQTLDRSQATWDGREDVPSEPSDNESDDEHRGVTDRSKRKKLIQMGVAGALAAGIGGAAFAFFKHKRGDSNEGDHNQADREKDELRRRQEDEDRRRQEQRLHQDHQVLPSHSGSVRGNYQLSSRNARLWSDGNHCFLVADCDSGGGRYKESRIDLDQIVTNANGEFRWVHRGDTGNFSGTAQRWEVQDGHIMSAELKRVDGTWNRTRLDLSEFIKNDGGYLIYTK